MRALFKLKCMIGQSQLLPSQIMKLFDRLVKPIALYGAEIWLTDLLNGNDNEAVLKKLTSLYV